MFMLGQDNLKLAIYEDVGEEDSSDMASVQSFDQSETENKGSEVLANGGEAANLNDPIEFKCLSCEQIIFVTSTSKFCSECGTKIQHF